MGDICNLEMPLAKRAASLIKTIFYLSSYLIIVFTLAEDFVLAQNASENAVHKLLASQQTLEGKIDQADSIESLEQEFASQNGRAATRNVPGYLKGSAEMGELDAAKEDPDADDKELMIAWDRWRNRFLQAVLASTSEMLNSDQGQSFQINPKTHVMEPKYPVGTEAWFVCEVTKDRQIKRLRILTPSGFADYDQAVVEAVQALQGSSLLRFPTGSRRVAVLQGGAVERAQEAQQQNFRFGDVERYRVPGY